MAAIKRFFQKRKLDVKFKVAGEGHRLTDDTRDRGAVSSGASQQRREAPSDASRAASQAAMARMSHAKPPAAAAALGTSAASVKAQVRQEMAQQQTQQRQLEADAALFSGPREVELEGAAMLSVRFHCPLIGTETFSKDEIDNKIEEFLLSQLAEEPLLTSALMIYTFNRDKEKVSNGVTTISKYIENINANPGEPKYRKIRMQNKAFQERVAPLQGVTEFLQSVGFELRTMEGPQQVDEDFYVLPDDVAGRLDEAIDALHTAEPIRAELHRDPQVFHPSHRESHIQVPPDFYTISPEELKKEQQLKREAVERLGMLQTKEMRARAAQRELRKYRYTLIRIRMPDGIILQGTFRAHDRLVTLFEFVRESLRDDWMPFHISTQTGHKLTDENLSLAEAELAPAALVTLSWDDDLVKDIAAQRGEHVQGPSLRDELLSTIQQLDRKSVV